MSEPPATNGSALDYAVGNKKPPVERQFGQPNGNPMAPSGAPRGTKQVKKRLRNRLIQKLRDQPEQLDAIVDGLVAGCAEGDGACQRIAWDRVDGVLEKKIDIRARAIVKVLVRGDDTESP